jgi:DivIVA domain-containing protein
MGVDQTSLDRIRNATFPSSKRGYDKQEVEKFLSRLADWLETGGGDESRSETVKRELERVGERTGAILSQAEDSAQEIISEARTDSDRARSDADAYAEERSAEADAYSDSTRKSADADAAKIREGAAADAGAAIADAEAQAQRIVEEGTRRREDVESVIADLVSRRDEVIVDIESLKGKLSAAATEHRPADEGDRFAVPEQLDPAAREAEAKSEPEPKTEPFDQEEADLLPTGEEPEADASDGRQLKA